MIIAQKITWQKLLYKKEKQYLTQDKTTGKIHQMTKIVQGEKMEERKKL